MYTVTIADNVCRTPNITLIDTDNVSPTESEKTSKFDSFEALFNESDCNYQSLIESNALIVMPAIFCPDCGIS